MRQTAISIKIKVAGKMEPKLNPQYESQGFTISKFNEKSWVLTFKDKPVFLFGSNLLIRSDFVDKLCQAFLEMHRL